MKPLTFLGDALDQIRAFPLDARRMAGFQLARVQRGLKPDDWKPLKTIGAGVEEVRIRETSGAYRVIYIARLKKAVYVLHAFHKKAQRTSKRDLELARQRLKSIDDE